MYLLTWQEEGNTLASADFREGRD